MVAKLSQEALLARYDIKCACRLFPVHPRNFDLFGFVFEGIYYYDKLLPMRCSNFCAAFECFSIFLEWCLTVKSGITQVSHYVDDFLFVGRRDSAECRTLLNYFFDLAGDLGVPSAWAHQSVWATYPK